MIPTPETYSAVPEWIKPSPSQMSIPHDISVDFIACPQIRDAIVQRQDLQGNVDWLSEFNNTASCNWPESGLNHGLAKDGVTGVYTLKAKFVEHINDLDNWSVGPRFRALMPNVDLYIRIKYDDE